MHSLPGVVFINTWTEGCLLFINNKGFTIQRLESVQFQCPSLCPCDLKRIKSVVTSPDHSLVFYASMHVCPPNITVQTANTCIPLQSD